MIFEEEERKKKKKKKKRKKKKKEKRKEKNYYKYLHSSYNFLPSKKRKISFKTFDEL